MIRINKLRILIIALLALIPAGCKKEESAAVSNSTPSTSSSEARPSTPVTSNSNSTAQPDSPAPSDKSAGSPAAPNTVADPAKMIGTYEITQVQKEGVVVMLSESKTQITFSPEGTYTRVSKRKDEAVHDDQGRYRIEGGDQLVLTIQMSKKTIHDPPIEKRHKISLSEDGEELKMISDKGDIAIFRKIKKT